jgi:hypothetical protein
MVLSDEKSRFIRNEFDCFVRIGMDEALRSRVVKIIRRHLDAEDANLPPPVFHMETRNLQGEVTEMWYLEPDRNQLQRLQEFLQRFSVDDVKLIESLMRH